MISLHIASGRHSCSASSVILANYPSTGQCNLALGLPVLVIATASCFAIEQLTPYIGVVNVIGVEIFKLENTAFSTPIT